MPNDYDPPEQRVDAAHALGRGHKPANAPVLKARPRGSAPSFFQNFPPALASLRDSVLRVAPQDTPVLLRGEPGTGKTYLARWLHELSPRRDQPFLVINCGALSPTLVAREMFGDAEGAVNGADRQRPGKFAAAGRGTLVLDDIDRLPLALQGKVAQALEAHRFAPVGSDEARPLLARVLAISCAALEEEVVAGRFRPDLYARLNGVSFALPPLRDRPASVGPLSEQWLAEFAARHRPGVQGIHPRALRALCDYHWPGNVRQLRNVIERAVALSSGPLVEFADLPEAIRQPGRGPERP
jgi:two-component system response regulator HydG